MLQALLMAGTLLAGSWEVTDSGEWNQAECVAGGDGVEEMHFTGDGNGKSAMRRHCVLEPDSLYRVGFDLLGTMEHREWPIGTPYVELPFQRLELWEYPTRWRRFVKLCRSPLDWAGDGYLEIGQENHTGSAAFRQVTVEKLHPIKLTCGDDLQLGDREAVFGNTLYANSELLDGRTAGLNRRQELAGPDASVTWEYRLPGRKFVAAEWRINGRNLRLEASADGETFLPVAEHAADGKSYRLPEGSLGGSTLFLRLRAGQEGPGSFQFSRLSATFDGAPLEARGRSFYAAETPETDRVTLSFQQLSGGTSTDHYRLIGRVYNPTAAASTVKPELVINDRAVFRGETLTVGPQEQRFFPLDFALPESGDLTLNLQADGAVAQRVYVFIPSLYDASYGALLPGNDDNLTLWTADAGWRVGRHRSLPAAEAPAVKVALAKNEAESVQLVLASEYDQSDVQIDLSALENDAGGQLPADTVEIRMVDYLFLPVATDRQGTIDFWPDVLAPLSGGITLRGGENQPVWLTVRIPAETAAGLYRGTVTIRGAGTDRTVPLEVEVFDFALPDTLHCPAMTSLQKRYIEECQKAETPADKQAAYDQYMQLMKEYHLSPYEITPYAPIEVDWQPETTGGPTAAVDVPVDFSRFDAEVERVLRQYRFNRFVLELPTPPGIDRLNEPLTPFQERMIADVYGKINRHIVEKNWQEIAFVYVWDEPHPSAFPEVDACLQRLRRYAPDLKLLVTPFWIQRRWEPNLDIWCFLSHHYVEWAAQRCRDNGEELWWYVCTGPREPYAGLFIDHPALELRTWLWQTWANRIDGVLIWSSTFWCDANAPGYPARDIYRQPLVINESGGEFGNGDGSLLYPPRAAYDPSVRGPLPDGPVPSQRLAMWRDGLEDYEYFVRLRELLADRGSMLPPAERRDCEELLTVPEAVSYDLFAFSRNPAALQAHRLKLARAIEKLSKMNFPENH